MEVMDYEMQYPTFRSGEGLEHELDPSWGPLRCPHFMNNLSNPDMLTHYPPYHPQHRHHPGSFQARVSPAPPQVAPPHNSPPPRLRVPTYSPTISSPLLFSNIPPPNPSTPTTPTSNMSQPQRGGPSRGETSGNAYGGPPSSNRRTPLPPFHPSSDFVHPLANNFHFGLSPQTSTPSASGHPTFSQPQAPSSPGVTANSRDREEDLGPRRDFRYFETPDTFTGLSESEVGFRSAFPPMATGFTNSDEPGSGQMLRPSPHFNNQTPFQSAQWPYGTPMTYGALETQSFVPPEPNQTYQPPLNRSLPIPRLPQLQQAPNNLARGPTQPSRNAARPSSNAGDATPNAGRSYHGQTTPLRSDPINIEETAEARFLRLSQPLASARRREYEESRNRALPDHYVGSGVLHRNMTNSQLQGLSNEQGLPLQDFYEFLRTDPQGASATALSRHAPSNSSRHARAAPSNGGDDAPSGSGTARASTSRHRSVRPGMSRPGNRMVAMDVSFGPKRATKRFIESLKPFDLSTLDKDDQNCSICMEPFGKAEPIKGKIEHPIKLPCKHVFGQTCITTWLEGHSTCPVCRKHVDSETLPRTTPPSRHRFRAEDMTQVELQQTILRRQQQLRMAALESYQRIHAGAPPVNPAQLSTNRSQSIASGVSTASPNHGRARSISSQVRNGASFYVSETPPPGNLGNPVASANGNRDVHHWNGSQAQANHVSFARQSFIVPLNRESSGLPAGQRRSITPGFGTLQENTPSGPSSMEDRSESAYDVPRTIEFGRLSDHPTGPFSRAIPDGGVAWRHADVFGEEDEPELEHWRT
ncbi:MAG: hypothetical protein M4579_005060 [Chaenotheca gracillima]|nr:MAG: hypothetical protein M4579_005060 [Chaenotheca gracillima]